VRVSLSASAELILPDNLMLTFVLIGLLTTIWTILFPSLSSLQSFSPILWCNLSSRHSHPLKDIDPFRQSSVPESSKFLLPNFWILVLLFLYWMQKLKKSQLLISWMVLMTTLFLNGISILVSLCLLPWLSMPSPSQLWISCLEF